MRVTCKHCGGAHPAFECRKKKSGASVALASNDRVHDPAAIHLTVQPKASLATGRVGQKSTATSESRSSRSRSANESLPVDDIHPGEISTIARPNVAREPDAVTGKFDKKAWMRSKMPAYMRQYRADVKAGLRVPKPKASKPIQ